MGQTGTAAAAATRAGVRSPMVVRSRATDGRSASSGLLLTLFAQKLRPFHCVIAVPLPCRSH